MERIYVEATGPGRGFSIEYDLERNEVLIDGVAFAPEVLLTITRPDPTMWIRLVRNDDDTVTAHQMFNTIAP